MSKETFSVKETVKEAVRQYFEPITWLWKQLRGGYHPQVGIALIVYDGNGRVLLGTRKKKGPGYGKWQFPGGHLEMYESLEDCATRETREEVGIEVRDVFFLDLSNNPSPKHKCHYVTLFLAARHATGTPYAVEPDKCDNWTWFSLDNMPPGEMLFESMAILTPENKAKIRNRLG